VNLSTQRRYGALQAQMAKEPPPREGESAITYANRIAAATDAATHRKRKATRKSAAAARKRNRKAR
jgi:hypothetical protein